MRPLIENLDELPLPARHLLPPVADYTENLLRNDFFMRKSIIPMITSRGCTVGCCFCSFSKVFQRRWRARSAKSVVDEMEYLIKHFGAREIHFLDDNINLNKNRMFEICNEIIRRKLNIKWVAVSGMFLWSLDEELLKLMKKSGCYRVGFGIESGNLETIKFIGNKFDRQRIIETYKTANKIGLWTQSCFVLGFPFEKLESLQDTLELAIDCQSDISVFDIATPYPGTRLYEIVKDEGLLPKTDKYVSQVIGGCDTKYFTASEIKSFADSCFGIFFSSRLKRLLKNPFYLLSKVRRFEEIKYTLKIGYRFLIIFFNRMKFGKYSFTGLRR